MNSKILVSEFLMQCGKHSFVHYLEYPSDPTMWDVALPCFVLAKELKQSPMQIAQQIAQELTSQLIDQKLQYIANIVAVGPYVNFMMNWAILGEQLISQIINQKLQYWRWEVKHELILVESPWPNTNKPLHLGHVRNMLLGNSLALILGAAGYEVRKVDVVNDRGIHICKSMLAYQKLGNGAEPNKKSDHYVWDRYVAFDTALEHHPEWEQEAQDMLRQWESGDETIRQLWYKMNQRCLDGHAITYQRYGTVIEKAYLESDHYLTGKDLVNDGIQKWVFRVNEKGNVVADLSNDQEKVVLRADGTSIYITQDLALWNIRYEDYHMNRMIYVVGNEQNDHFKALFEIFSQLWYAFADQCHHLSYWMIELPDGKMKSRKGNVVDADNLIDDMHAKCVELLLERHPELDEIELHRRAEIIAMAAIKMFILKYDAAKNFVFDRDHSLSFDGETWPYVLYSYARAKTILYKANKGEEINPLSGGIQVTQDERVLLWMIAKFEEIIQEAADQYAPTIVAKYVLSLASEFNSYYHHTKILDESVAETTRSFRLWLVSSVAQVLQNGLMLLGIDTLEQM